MVYRIEYADTGRGPYNSSEFMSHEILLAHIDCGTGENHPTPANDIGIGRQPEKDEYCGFDSAAKLLQWFKGFIPQLLSSGHIIKIYCNVEITATGEKQVLFKYLSARKD